MKATSPQRLSTELGRCTLENPEIEMAAVAGPKSKSDPKVVNDKSPKEIAFISGLKKHPSKKKAPSKWTLSFVVEEEEIHITATKSGSGNNFCRTIQDWKDAKEKENIINTLNSDDLYLTEFHAEEGVFVS